MWTVFSANAVPLVAFALFCLCLHSYPSGKVAGMLRCTFICSFSFIQMFPFYSNIPMANQRDQRCKSWHHSTRVQKSDVRLITIIITFLSLCYGRALWWVPCLHWSHLVPTTTPYGEDSEVPRSRAWGEDSQASGLLRKCPSMRPVRKGETGKGEKPCQEAPIQSGLKGCSGV